MEDKIYQPEWEKFFENPDSLPDEVITLDLDEENSEEDFDIDIDAPSPRSIKSLEEIGGELYENLRYIRTQLEKEERVREEQSTEINMSVINNNFIFHLWFREAGENKAWKKFTSGSFVSLELAQKVGAFLKSKFNFEYKITKETLFLNTAELAEAHPGREEYLELLTPEERKALMKKRALTKLSQEEREALGL